MFASTRQATSFLKAGWAANGANRYAFLPFTILSVGFKGCVRFRYHCCPMPTRLLVKMYTASPEEIGKMMNIAANEIGMNFIIACC